MFLRHAHFPNAARAARTRKCGLAFVATAGFMVLLPGCVHQRSSMLVSVEDLGPQIETRHRYVLVAGGETSWEVQDQLVQINLNLQKAQPKVFAPDGIPFVRSGNFWGRVPRYDDANWTMVFVPTLVLPVMSSGAESSSTCTIDVLDNPDAHASFTAKAKRDTVFALLSPLPMLCYPGTAGFEEEPESCRTYSSHAVSLMGGTPIMEYGDAIDDFGSGLKVWGFNSVDAYGIAVLLKRMEDSGQIDASRCRTQKKKRQMTDSPASEGFDLVDMRKDAGRGYGYSFVLKSRSGNVSLRESRKIQQELREMIRNDFSASFPAANRAVLVVDFTKYALVDGELRGTASVLPMDVVSFDYDKHTRKGRMKIRVEAALLEDARTYCRRSIESIVRDKNIALQAGEVPPAAQFTLRDETVKDGLLEITFKAE